MKSVSLSNLTNKSRKIEIQNWRLEKFGTKGWLTKISFWLAEDFSGRLSFISNKIWTSHQGLRGQEEQRNRRTGKARAPSFQAAELQVHRYNQSPKTTLLVKRELSLAQKWWTLQDLQDWHHLHLLHPESGGQEETFHICQRHQGADHAKDLRADRLRTILRVHREQAKEWEKKLKSNRYWSVSQSRTRSAEQPKKPWYVTDATRKMHGFKRMLGELDGKDLRQEWQMVTPMVLRECQGKNEGKWEIDNDQVDAIDTHDTFEFQNVLSFWPAKGGEDKVWNYKICVESQRIESIQDIQSREMIFYDYSARNTRIAMEIIAIETSESTTRRRQGSQFSGHWNDANKPPSQMRVRLHSQKFREELGQWSPLQC